MAKEISLTVSFSIAGVHCTTAVGGIAYANDLQKCVQYARYAVGAQGQVDRLLGAGATVYSVILQDTSYPDGSVSKLDVTDQFIVV